jgi:nucleoside-diphosphate-sugar epimerase
MSEPYRAGVALVTGASGFIGGRLRDALLADGYDVVALTRKGSPDPKKGRGAPVDYADAESLERVLEKERPEYVFHVAGATKGVKYEDFRRANVMPTANLLASIKRVHPNIKRFLHVSSLTCYGPSSATRPIEEDDERKPVEHYGKSKLEAEQVVDAASKDVPVTIIRPPAVYGPGDVDAFELFRWAARRLNLFYGNRDVMMSYVYVDDLVRGMREAAAHDAALGKGYFLCDGEPRTWGLFQGEIVRFRARSSRRAARQRSISIFLGARSTSRPFSVSSRPCSTASRGSSTSRRRCSASSPPGPAATIAHVPTLGISLRST